MLQRFPIEFLQLLLIETGEMLQHGNEQVILGIEIVEDRPLGDAGFLGDLARGGAVEPDVAENTTGGFQDLGPACLNLFSL